MFLPAHGDGNQTAASRAGSELHIIFLTTDRTAITPLPPPASQELESTISIIKECHPGLAETWCQGRHRRFQVGSAIRANVVAGASGRGSARGRQDLIAVIV